MTKYTTTDLAKLGYEVEGDKATPASKKTRPGRKGNKFNAKRTVYAGVTYDSKKEARYAAQLDMQRKAEDPRIRVVGVARQVRYKIVVNGTLIGTYVLDFLVRYADNHKEHIDVKGLRTGAAYELFRLKKKLVETIYHIKIKEV